MSKIILFFIALLTLLAFYFSPELVKWLEVSTSIPFDAFAALASAFAFIGMIYTISLQAKELKLQREDLKLTRQEMQETREEIKGQKEAMERQNVDRLFSLLVETYCNSFLSISKNENAHNTLKYSQELTLIVNRTPKDHLSSAPSKFYEYYDSILLSLCNIIDFCEKSYRLTKDLNTAKLILNSIVDPKIKHILSIDLYSDYSSSLFELHTFGVNTIHNTFYKLYERRDLIKEYLSLEVPE